MLTRIDISEDCLAEVYVHAREAYPNECCGFLLDDGIRKCENIQDKLAGLSADNDVRTSKNGFAFGFDDLLYLTKSLRSEKPVQCIYHSHPDVGAYFSEEDKRYAINNGIPVYPVKHLVVDIRYGVVRCAKVFDFIDGDYRLMNTFPGLFM